MFREFSKREVIDLFDKLQSVGKALMLPVAVLPAAAILLRFGANDLLDIDVLERAGGVSREFSKRKV